MSARSRPKQPRHFTLAPLKLVCRESTGPVAPSAALIERAKDIVTSEAVKGATVAEIVKRLGVSRRLLELRYRETEGITLCQALMQRRLEVAKKLILTTSRKIVQIAAECGFSDAKHLTHALKSAYGKSPRELRQDKS
jgi:LacI family transcriptional regulator